MKLVVLKFVLALVLVFLVACFVEWGVNYNHLNFLISTLFGICLANFTCLLSLQRKIVMFEKLDDLQNQINSLTFKGLSKALDKQ
ncbi:hypothetical protein HT819_003903 [Salmonella enterica]|nr:hypothetical protein [Salmonella enterica]